MPLWIFSIGRFLKGIPNQVWLFLAGLAALWLIINFHNNAVDRAFDKGNTAGIDTTTAAFEKAQAEADAIQIAKIEKLKDVQETITEDLVNEHEAETSSIIARYNAVRVRLAAETAAKRSAGIGIAAPVSDPAEETDGTTEANELSATVPISYLEAAELQTSQLIKLQEWIKQQQAAWPSVAAPTP